MHRSFTQLVQCFPILLAVLSLLSCTTVKKPPIAPWQPPEWVPKGYPSINKPLNSTNTNSTALTNRWATPIKRVRPSKDKQPIVNFRQNAFWQRQVSLSFDQITLKKAIEGLSKSYQFTYRNLLAKPTIIKQYHALKTPLADVLNDLSELSNTRILIQKNAIVIQENKPYWAQYTIHYPNIKRTSLTKSQFNQSIDHINNNQNTQANVTIDNEFKNDFWQHLDKNLSAIVASFSSQSNNPSQILIHPETGAVNVYGSNHLQRQIKSIIHKVNNQASRQAHIELAIMEVTLNDEYEAGIDWSVFESGNNANIISQQAIGANLGSAPRIYTNITGVLDGISLNFGARLIEQFGTTQVLSSPQIRLINNQTALLKVVDNIVYFTIKTNTIQNDSVSTTSFETQAKSVSVGIVIALTATILPDDSLIINLKPTLSRVAQFSQDPHPELAKNNIQSLIPVLRERELESFLHIKPNEVTVIGGLIQNRDNQQASQLPGSSGLLGFDSKQANNTELILFLRANVF